jgi:hypothetical protein
VIKIAPQAPVPVLLRSPSPCPHAQNRFWVGEGNAGDFRTVFEIVRQSLPVETGLARLQVDTRDSRFMDDHKGRVPGRIETVKSGAMIFFGSSPTMTSQAICRRGKDGPGLCMARHRHVRLANRCGKFCADAGTTPRPENRTAQKKSLTEWGSLAVRVCSSWRNP